VQSPLLIEFLLHFLEFQAGGAVVFLALLEARRGALLFDVASLQPFLEGGGLL